MKGFFDPRVNKIVELIDGQIDFIEKEMMTDVKVSPNHATFQI
jgi:hypothetical protein